MQEEHEIVQATHLFVISVERYDLMLIFLQVSMVTQVENDGSQLRRNVFSPLE